VPVLLMCNPPPRLVRVRLGRAATSFCMARGHARGSAALADPQGTARVADQKLLLKQLKLDPPSQPSPRMTAATQRTADAAAAATNPRVMETSGGALKSAVPRAPEGRIRIAGPKLCRTGTAIREEPLRPSGGPDETGGRRRITPPCSQASLG